MKRLLSITAALLAFVAQDALAQPSPGAKPARSPREIPLFQGPDGALLTLPLTFPYDPDVGVPPGYVLRERVDPGWVTAGALTFGTLWVLSGIVASVQLATSSRSQDSDPVLFIPVAGPFVQMAQRGWSSYVLLDGLAQTAGVAMIVRGIVWPQKLVRYQPRGPARTLDIQPIAAPMAGGGFVGLSGTF